MKDYIVLEINGKKECLGAFKIDTPNELFLINSIEPILNIRKYVAQTSETEVYIKPIY